MVHVNLTHEQLSIVLRALDIYAIDMHSASTVTGSGSALIEAEAAEALMDELETYIEDPDHAE